jgi:tRNA pseudouridine55 synthase
VAKIRGELRKKYGQKLKVGHGGTLDPFATGVLLILIGKATRRFDEIRGWEKEYEMEIKLGELTDTGDSTGKVTKTQPTRTVPVGKVKKVLKQFVPGYEQTVPIFSAIQIGGKRLYKLARAGEKVKLPVRAVKISRLKLINLQGDSLQVQVVCGSGTYMRQLAVDIGEKLGLPAHALSLRRTRVGKYSVAKII